MVIHSYSYLHALHTSVCCGIMSVAVCYNNYFCYLKVFIYIGEMCRYLLAQPITEVDNKHSIRIILGNGLSGKVWPNFQKRFQIPKIVEIYASTEGNCSFINAVNKVGSIGSLSRVLPFMNPACLVKINTETGEYLRNKKGFCIEAGVDEPGEVVGKIMAHVPSTVFGGYTDPNASVKKVMTDVFAKGDKYFLSGDILRMDEEGFLYFVDRMGDTFRWKGENVSTIEVQSIITNILQLRDVVVYGVEVPGNEGRAGMAAIEGTKDSVDLSSLAQQLFLSLPAYAVPLFIRLVPSAEMTGTFKLKKVKLRNEGFSIALPDPLFMLNASYKVYQPLTVELYHQIQDGKLRL